MSLLTSIAALSSAENVKVVAPVDYNTLIQKGNFYPSTTLTPQVQKYRDYKYGWLIDYTMSTYNGHWADQRGQVPPPPEMFSIANVNVAQWAIEAQNRSVDYAVLSVFTEYGFLLYPSQVDYNMPRLQIGQTFSPYYPKYCVQPGNDGNILQKFVTAFDSRGIEPCFYFGFGGNMNLANTTGGQMFENDVPSSRKELIIQYYCKVAQEIARKNPRVKYYWVDMAAVIPQQYIQRLYNAFKSINPGIVIIGNALGESNFSRFPYDIASVEEYIAYNNPGFIDGNTLSFNGTTYHIPREIVGTMYSDYSQWYYYDDLCPVQPVNNPFTNQAPYVKMQAVAPATFQGLVDNAKDSNRPFLSVMLVDRYGDLVPETLDYVDQISFFPNI